MNLSDLLSKFSNILQEIGANLYVKAFQNKGMAALSIGQYRYLELISKKGDTHVSELARLFNVKKPTVTKVIQKLERSELVFRKRSFSDKRIFHLYLTNKARDIFAYRNKMYKIMADRIENILSQQRIKQLKEILHLLLQKV